MATRWHDITSKEYPRNGQDVTAYDVYEQKGVDAIWDGNDFVGFKNGKRVVIVASHWMPR